MAYGMKVTFYICMEDFEKFYAGSWVLCMGTPRDTYMKIKSEMNDVEVKEEEESNGSSAFFVRRRKIKISETRPI